MTPIKINNSNIINVSLFFFPLAFILGNSITNINFVIFTVLGVYYVFRNKINIPFDNLIKIIFCLFLIIILSSILNLINNYHNINHPDITINDYWESLKKSLIFFRYFIFTLVFVALSNYGLINFKYILSSILFFSLCLSVDIIIQSFFGSNILGFKQIADGVNSGFFGKELVAGGYLQRLSIPALFFLYYLFRNNKNYNSFIFVAGISLIGIGIILASNRMPLLSFLLGMSLFLLACKNLRKNILVGILIVLLSFVFIFKNHNYTNEKFHSFVGAIERIVRYTGITISTQVKKVTNEKFEEKPLDRIYYRKGAGYLELYRAAIYTFKENYILGNGPKNFFNSCIKINNKFYKLGRPIDCNRHPHNYYLEILSSLGIIGILFFTFFFYKLCKIFFKEAFNRNINFNNINNVVFTSSLITLMVELFPLKSSGSFYSTSSAIYVFLFMAMMIGTRTGKSKIKN